MIQEQDAAIHARQITFCYEEREVGDTLGPVIRNVTFSVQKGTFVSIVGHNGSGKSTLAKMMNALLLPTEGVLIVSGFETHREETLWEVRRAVGLVFQNPDNQIVGTSVEDDVAFGLENMGVDPKEMRQRVDEALRSVKMDGFQKEQPHRLSGGQKQRVAIAGIMALRPSVIILDEATAMLDPQGRKEVVALAHRLHREHGITIVNITHFPEETLLSDRVIVMQKGQIVLDGTPHEVYNQVERLWAMDLEVPFAVRMRHKLALADHIHILHQEQLVEDLCRLL